ncbi:DNA polymerase III subunit chi [Sulfuriflexus sp.]|uniref:DNA polymerase III subunit chi n=1 Tax=Sulfuriflexus sp. TaxID=2015443 RepID=UPI0028CF75ED|nr:DNA polymerase III subunit chi [Sulfuriflexus sp.]MDT8403632.1 DNA polymerase III subunit chi [Sulfuriflexus sp.]
MTRVDFYLTRGSDEQQRLLTACRLAEKAYQLGHHVFVYADKPALAKQLDELLWSFRPGSFLPHSMSDAVDAEAHPLVIGDQHPDEASHDVMINLAESVPDCFSRFKRVAEVVGGSENERQVARQRFRFYRDRGYALETHELRN